MDTKKIRAKLLDLAVRGKLVSQDPADEPASVLLGRIREERTKLVREKKAKAPKGGESVIYLASDGASHRKSDIIISERRAGWLTWVSPRVSGYRIGTKQTRLSPIRWYERYTLSSTSIVSLYH